MTNINWNGDAESAPFKSRFDDESENLILAETDTGTALFEWDGSAWQFRGPVEMNGEDVSGIGSLTATSGNFDSVKTDRLNNAAFASPDGQSIADAIDAAGVDGHVIVLPGNYQESDLNPQEGQTVEGWGEVVVEGGDSFSFLISNNEVRVKNIKAESPSESYALTVTGEEISLVNCWGLDAVEAGVRFGADAKDSSMVGGASVIEISISGSAENIETSGVLIL